MTYYSNQLTRPDFITAPILAGTRRLPAELTINDQTETPVFRYYGQDATVSAWTAGGYGEALNIAGSGSDPTPNEHGPFLTDDSVLFNAGKAYSASGNDFANITTEDFVLELVFKWSATNSLRLFGKYGGGLGYLLYETSDIPYFAVGGGGGSATAVPATLTDNAWYHFIVFYDASGSMQVYINGTASGSAVSVSSVGSLTVAHPIGIGCSSFSGAPQNVYDSNIAYCAMWKKDAWLDTHLQADVAKERFSKLLGIYPQIAKGTSTPEVITRATDAYLDKLEGSTRKLYYVGDNWLRMCSREDSNSDEIKGYLSEASAIQLCKYSEAFNSWTPAQASIAVDQIAGLDGRVTADILHEDNTPAAGHNVSITQNTTTDGVTYCYSVWAKAINRTWIALAYPGVWSWFDIGNGVVGTKQHAASGIEDWGNGWYRCWVKYVKVGTGGVAHYIFVATGNGNSAFDGLDQDSIYLWGAQLEAGSYPSSYIPNSGTGTVTRNGDQLRYKGDDGNITNNGMGTIKCDVLKSFSGTDSRLFGFNDGGAAADSIIAQDQAGKLRVLTAASGGDAGAVYNASGISIGDDEIHSIKVAWKTDNLKSFVDGTIEGTDTDADMPDDLDRILVGASSTTDQFNGLIRNVRIYDRFGVAD